MNPMEKASVIVPTWERPERHANLYRAFRHQSYPAKELLTFDDSTSAAQIVLMGGGQNPVLHLLHRANTSNTFPQTRIPAEEALAMLGSEAAPWLTAPIRDS